MEYHMNEVGREETRYQILENDIRKHFYAEKPEKSAFFLLFFCIFHRREVDKSSVT
ncbi:hypothetical protein BLGI_3030 [Brevibacillus laterosporus GI-9]|nr:hypothetical protein BLGI_3030 [Brevibacillus laterosporus GI-9]